MPVSQRAMGLRSLSAAHSTSLSAPSFLCLSEYVRGLSSLHLNLPTSPDSTRTCFNYRPPEENISSTELGSIVHPGQTKCDQCDSHMWHKLSYRDPSLGGVVSSSQRRETGQTHPHQSGHSPPVFLCPSECRVQN